MTAPPVLLHPLACNFCGSRESRQWKSLRLCESCSRLPHAARYGFAELLNDVRASGCSAYVVVLDAGGGP